MKRIAGCEKDQKQEMVAMRSKGEGVKFIVIGITDNPQPWFPPEVLEIIRSGKVFSGGKRHHEIVAPLLPEGAEWINIIAPLDKVFEQYSLTPDPSPRERGVYSSFADKTTNNRSSACLSEAKTNYSPLLGRGVGGEAIIVFASGDPLFFGFANTIRRKMPEAEIVVYPTFNSLQMLAHRLLMPYHDMQIVSLTGRPWPEFDRALIENSRQRFQALQNGQGYIEGSRQRFQALQGGQGWKIGVLTDKEHTPAAIAQRMLEYGYTDYTMHIGEHLGNPAKERVTTLTLEEAAQREFEHPNCVILHSVVGEASKLCNAPSAAAAKLGSFTHYRGTAKLGSFTHYGIPDAEFTLLDGREKMITKMPIRLLTLQALDLPRKHVFWDIGFCTGSVSIEARLLFPHLQIEAFEIRPKCEAIIHENARRFGAPGINVHIGDFLSTPLPIGEGSGVRLPDAVFIGGHGGRLKEIMAKVLTVLADDGCIVMNSVKAPLVKTNSHQLWDEACRELGLQQEPPLRIQLNDYHPIDILKAQK